MAKRLLLRCVTAKTAATPPTPRTPSIRYFPATDVPTCESARARRWSSSVEHMDPPPQPFGPPHPQPPNRAYWHPVSLASTAGHSRAAPVETPPHGPRERRTAHHRGAPFAGLDAGGVRRAAPPRRATSPAHRGRQAQPHGVDPRASGARARGGDAGPLSAGADAATAHARTPPARRRGGPRRTGRLRRRSRTWRAALKVVTRGRPRAKPSRRSPRSRKSRAHGRNLDRLDRRRRRGRRKSARRRSRDARRGRAIRRSPGHVVAGHLLGPPRHRQWPIRHEMTRARAAPERCSRPGPSYNGEAHGNERPGDRDPEGHPR